MIAIAYRRSPSQRAAATLLEVLVVLTIISLAAGLVFAAVQRTRAAAASTTCRNNLRQLSLAAQSYVSSHGCYPPGVSGGMPNQPYPFMGWPTRLLPQLGEEPRWQKACSAYATDRNFLHVPPHEGLTQSLPVFACPLDGRTGSPQIAPNSSFLVGLTSYPGVLGTTPAAANGIMFLDSTVKPTAIADGSSNTLLIGERPPSADLRFGWWYAGWGQDQDGDAEMILGVRSKPNNTAFSSCPRGPRPYSGGKFADQCAALQFWSPHSGGANFALADGSVRFLSYSADSVMPALATRAGGEAVGLSD